MAAGSNRRAQQGGEAVLLLLAARCGGALLTAACIVLAFTTPDQGWLAWAALVPLLLACESLGPVVTPPPPVPRGQKVLPKPQ